MDLTEPALSDAFRIVLAMTAGGLIGLEREFRDKAAGFRTLIFIGAGSALFTVLSHNIGGVDDPARIAANIVTGIGFLGAGAILRDGMRVAGLTTAATIWLTAAIGMSFGAGEFLLGVVITLLGLIVLWVFPAFEHSVDRMREEHTYDIIIPNNKVLMASIESAAKKAGLKMGLRRHFREGDSLRCHWAVFGRAQAHEVFIQYLLDEPAIREFRY